MKSKRANDKQSLLKKVKSALTGQLGAAGAKQAGLFCDVFFKRVPIAELKHNTPDNAASMVINQIEFLKQRKKGSVSIRVFNPEQARDGWDCQHTVVEMSNDDMPFLVDTSSMVMQELNLGVHLIVHPVLNVERDTGGQLKSIQSKSTKTSIMESFIHIHLDKQTDRGVLASIEKQLQSRLVMIRATVADWQPMKESLKRVISEFGKDAPDLSEKVGNYWHGSIP